MTGSPPGSPPGAAALHGHGSGPTVNTLSPVVPAIHLRLAFLDP